MSELVGFRTPVRGMPRDGLKGISSGAHGWPCCMGFHAKAWCGGAAVRPHDGTSDDRRRKRNTSIQKISTRANLSTMVAVWGACTKRPGQQKPWGAASREIP